MRLLAFCALFLLAACGTDPSAQKTTEAAPPVSPPLVETASPTSTVMADNANEVPEATVPSSPKSVRAKPQPAKGGHSAKNGFVEIKLLDPSIRLDIRYATTDNFTKSKIYDCPACLLRPEAATAIVEAHKTLKKKGFGLVMFDCYRPRPYQQKLWDKVPNPDYVTPPAKGSMHSRGAAVDLSIVDAKGQELDMGTPYDFFGRAAHTDNLNLPKNVLENRRLLRETLESVGFNGIRTEWWHFSFQGKNWPLSDFIWPCE